MEKPLPLPFTAPLRGVSHRQEEVIQLQEGQRVRVVHEPDNAYDRNACAVYTDSGGMLGFIPAAIAGRLALRGEGSWRGRISEVRRGETWGASVTVDGPLNGPVAQVDEEPPMPAPVEQVEVRVLARSGRLLGTLVRREEGKVVVRSAGGNEVPYPSDLVKVES